VGEPEANLYSFILEKLEEPRLFTKEQTPSASPEHLRTAEMQAGTRANSESDAA
jgi:hypothetical protein